MYAIVWKDSRGRMRYAKTGNVVTICGVTLADIGGQVIRITESRLNTNGTVYAAGEPV